MVASTSSVESDITALITVLKRAIMQNRLSRDGHGLQSKKNPQQSSIPSVEPLLNCQLFYYFALLLGVASITVMTNNG